MNREHLSALMDGELDPEHEAALLAQWRSDGDMPRVWNEYHLIGDLLRESGIQPTCLGERVAQAMAQEPTVLAPASRSKAPRAPARWLAVAAAVGAVAVSTWTFQRYQEPAQGPALAVNPVAAPAQLASAAPVAAEMKPYVAMHRQWSPISGFQTVDYAAETGAGR
ncbi:MAG: sigma-E factor negative regulatory protein [Betaproteobacteria bacterium]|nr:sigma-E factor negative regulatory protein [Betaproteobacteria bacterium]